MDRVGIITRTRDRPVLLRRALAGVRDQLYPHWQLVVVNDGGDPRAVESERCAAGLESDPRVQVVHHTESHGMEAASNAGIRRTESDYIVIHDDDDSWQPEFLQTMIDALANRPHPRCRGMICHTTRVVERVELGTVLECERAPFNAHVGSVVFMEMLDENLFPPISFLYERAVWEELGGYDESLPVLGDWEFNLRFLMQYDIGVVPELLANYHHRPPEARDAYANTVTAGHDLHRRIEDRLRDRWIRRDLAAGKPGLGALGWMAARRGTGARVRE